MAMQKPKYYQDLELVVKRITADQYSRFEEIKSENEHLISDLEKISYIEKVGPDTNSQT